MLRHYTLPTHEPCQTRGIFFFYVLFSLIITLNSVKAIAQTTDTFEIKLKKIEYIDAKAKEHVYFGENSTNTELSLSRNYNHIFSRLKTTPTFNILIKLRAKQT